MVKALKFSNNDRVAKTIFWTDCSVERKIKSGAVWM
jgi:hypothetical protein